MKGKQRKRWSTKKRPWEERFWEKVEETPDGCWLWTAATDKDGYGVFVGAPYGTSSAHRIAYRFVVGLIPAGLTIDHLCRTLTCINPAHLEPVSNRENILRGDGITAVNARKTHCKRGHPLSGDNLYPRPDGDRDCRTCRRERGRRSHAGTSLVVRGQEAGVEGSFNG